MTAEIDRADPMGVTDIRSCLVRLARAAQRIDVRHYAESIGLSVEGHLAPEVRGLLGATLELLDHLVDRFEDPRDPVNGEPLAKQLVDLAFVARYELGSRLGQLDDGQGPDSRPREQLLYLCDCTLHRINHTLAALEANLCELAGWPSELAEDGHVVAALHVRSAYAKFRQRILAGRETQDPDELPGKLSQAVTEIVGLVCNEAAYVRYGDRTDLLELKDRIEAWLDGDHDPVAGRRLWQDFTGFVQLLRLINHRAELVEHDRRVVEEALTRLVDPADCPDTVPLELLDRLRSLFGRDPEVEELITSDCRRTKAWLRPLKRLGRELEVPPIVPVGGTT